MKLEFTGIKYIQGDVIIRQIKELPKVELEEITDGIIQPSETLGKAHKFAPNETHAKIYDAKANPEGGTITPNTQKFIVVDSNGVVMFHGKGLEVSPNLDTLTDHAAMKIPEGIYYVDIAREFDYDSMETVRVVD